MDAWANAWTRYYTAGKGNYMISAMEDTGTMLALTFLKNAGRVDLNRVLVLRTVSNYDREAPGSTPAESLKGLVSGIYSACMPALGAAQIVGGKVVHYLVEHWTECEKTVPGQRVYFFSAASMAEITSGASGSTADSNRWMTFPFLSTRNFVKFH
jgi:purine nucleoside permease